MMAMMMVSVIVVIVMSMIETPKMKTMMAALDGEYFVASKCGLELLKTDGMSLIHPINCSLCCARRPIVKTLKEAWAGEVLKLIKLSMILETTILLTKIAVLVKRMTKEGRAVVLTMIEVAMTKLRTMKMLMT